MTGPHTWCRHAHLLRTTLRLCHESSAQQTVQNPLEGVAYDQSTGSGQSAVKNQQASVPYGHPDCTLTNDGVVEGCQPGINRAVGKFQDEQAQRYLLKPDQPSNARILRVAILGAPNAGKSTLVNSLLTWKVNPVSTKVHTTRKNSLAVFTEGNTQLVFTDTPGVITQAERKKHHCDRSLLVDPKRSVDQVDLVGVMVDVANRSTRGALHREVLKILEDYQHIPSVLILNKVDELKKKDALLELINTLTEGKVGGIKVASTPVRKAKKKNKENTKELLGKLEERYGKLPVAKSKAVGILETENGNSISWPNEVNEESERTNEKYVENLEWKVDSSASDSNGLKIGEDRHESELSAQSRKDPDEDNHSDNAVYKTAFQYLEDKIDIRMNDLSNESMKIAKEKLNFGKDQFLNNDNSSESKDAETLTVTKMKPSESEKSNKLILQKIDRETVEVEGVQETDTSNKRVNIKKDLSKYETPWDELMPLNKETRRGWPHFDRVFIVSSLYGDGIMDIKTYFMDKAVEGDWEYHSSLVTDEDPLELAKQIVWSKMLDHLKGYIAYQMSPDISYWKVEDDILKIVMTLSVKHVERVIGPGGVIIKQIADKSQQALMDAFRCEVALKLVVRKIQSKRR